MTNNLFFVFDVESIGLHGEGFAVGYVITDDHGTCLEKGIFACSPDRAQGDDNGRPWVMEHVEPAIGRFNCETPRDVRRRFWNTWLNAKDRARASSLNLYMVSDVAWPVEANFLSACISDLGLGAFDGPYPLIDVSSVRLAKGLNPLGEETRLVLELPLHNPMADALQSARLLHEALNPVD
jgi:hypothetical protein